MEIAVNIQLARKNAKLTQKELADAIGKTTSSVQKYELGLSMPPLDVLNQIASVLGVSTGFLLYGSDFLLFGNGAEEPQLTPEAHKIGRAYEKATLPTQRVVEVALEPFMDESTKEP